MAFKPSDERPLASATISDSDRAELVRRAEEARAWIRERCAFLKSRPGAFESAGRLACHIHA